MNAEQHEWYWKGYNDAKKHEQYHPMMDMPREHKAAMAYGVWPFPPFPNPLDKGTKVPKFNPDNFEEAPI